MKREFSRGCRSRGLEGQVQGESTLCMNREAVSGFVRQMGMGGQSGEGELQAEREDRRCASLQATGVGVWCGGEGAARGVQVRKGYGGRRGQLSWVTWARRRSPTGESKTGARWTSQEATRGCPDLEERMGLPQGHVGVPTAGCASFSVVLKPVMTD